MAPNRDPNRNDRVTGRPGTGSGRAIRARSEYRAERDIGMARTKTAVVVATTKTARFRAILRENAAGPGNPVDPSGPGGIARAADAAGMGYAFAYGRAAATADPDFPGRSYADTRAARRGTRAIRVSANGSVIVRVENPTTGAVSFVAVDPKTGTIRRPKTANG